MINLIKWLDRIVEFPKRFYIENNEDGTITLVSAPGEIAEAGTPVNAENMNAIRLGVKNAVLYDRSISFLKSGLWMCPPGVTKVDAWVVGGGGSGGTVPEPVLYHKYSAGGGGGGYCSLFEDIPVTPGSAYNITVAPTTALGANGSYSQFHTSSYRSNGGTKGGNGSEGQHGVAGIGGSNGGSIHTQMNGFDGTLNPYDNMRYGAGGGAKASADPIMQGGNGGACGGGGGGSGYSSESGSVAGGSSGVTYNNTELPLSSAGANGYGAGGGGYSVFSGLKNTGGSGIVILYYKVED